jgi:hypothetical protein
MTASKVPWYTISHLQECIDELRSIIQELEHPRYSRGQFMVEMTHAYHHLNFAWNTSELKANRINEIDGGSDMNDWYRCEQMPKDLITTMELHEQHEVKRTPKKRGKR